MVDYLLTKDKAIETFQDLLTEWDIQDESQLMKMFQFTQSEFIVGFEQLARQFSISKNFVLTYLQQIAIIQIDGRYIVQPIHISSAKEDERKLELLIRTTFKQIPIEFWVDGVQSFRFYQKFVPQIMSKTQARKVLEEVTLRITKRNKKSLAIKQIQMLHVVYHFSLKSRFTVKHAQLIQRKWGSGKWALTEKEKTMLAYILMQETARRMQDEMTLKHALFLIENDRLANFAVELILDYGHLLPPFKPDSNIYVKNFRANYLEYTFFLTIEVLDRLQRYEEIVGILKQFPIASCDALSLYLHTREIDNLVQLEATMQRDIAYIVDQSHKNIRKSLQKWNYIYTVEGTKEYKIARQISSHTCRLLKAIFMTEQYSLFDKLMTAYNKYFFFEDDYLHLKNFVSSKMELIENLESFA